MKRNSSGIVCLTLTGALLMVGCSKKEDTAPAPPAKVDAPAAQTVPGQPAVGTMTSAGKYVGESAGPAGSRVTGKGKSKVKL